MKPARDDDLAALRRLDPGRHLLALAAPAGLRARLTALLAVDAEIARARFAVREPLLAAIRLQWWRDALAEYRQGQPARHAALRPLGLEGLDFALFETLLDAREAELEDIPFADTAALLAQADATGGTVLRLVLQLAGQDAPALREAVREVGRAWALATMLLSIPAQAAQGRTPLPADALAASGLTPRTILERRDPPALACAVRPLAGEASEALRRARALGPVPRAFLPAFLAARLAERQLGRLARAGFDPFHPGLARPDPWLAPHVAFSAWRGRW